MTKLTVTSHNSVNTPKHYWHW